MEAIKRKTPTLRFPEYNDEWLERELGDISIKIGDGLHGTPNYVDNSGYYFINGNNLVNGKISIYDTTKQVSYDEYKKNKKGLNKDTILISINGTIGSIARYDGENVMLGKSVGYFIFSNECPFYYYSLQTEKIQNNFNEELTGSTIKNLSLKTLRETKIFSPTFPEQTKIASFLTAVDDKIHQFSRKKELLEKYKKGIMQKIFSREVRFRDVDRNDYPEWKETKLGIISNDICYGMNSAAIPYDGENKYLRITDIDEETRLFKPNPLSSPDGEIEDRYILKKGDIVFARTGASVGKSYIYKENDGKLLFAGFLIKFSIKKADPAFIYYCTLTTSYQKWVQLMSMRSGQPGINAEEYKSFTFKIPASDEQQKIASFLSAIDQKITLISNQIGKMQTWKKGLLQKMFV